MSKWGRLRREKRKKKYGDAAPPPPSGPKVRKPWFQTWEWKSVKWAARAAVALFFFAYVLLAGSLGWAWVKLKWYRHYPTEAATEMAQKYLMKSSNPEKLRTWLQARRYTEADQLIKMLEPYTPKMTGLTFILYSDWMIQQGRMEEAVFWRQYARFRVRYDSLRCGSTMGISTMNNALEQFPRPEVTEALTKDPELLARVLRQVLDYDKKYPPVDNPYEFCRDLTMQEEATEHIHRKMVDPSHWQDIYATLRGLSILDIMRIEREDKEDAAAAAAEKDKDKDKAPAPEKPPETPRKKVRKPADGKGEAPKP